MVHQNFWEVLPALPGPAVRFCCLAPGTRAHQHESSISRMQLDVFSLFHTVGGWDMFNKSWIPCRGFCARNLQHCQGKIRATSNRNSCSTTHTHTQPSRCRRPAFRRFPIAFSFRLMNWAMLKKMKNCLLILFLLLCAVGSLAQNKQPPFLSILSGCATQMCSAVHYFFSAIGK